VLAVNPISKVSGIALNIINIPAIRIKYPKAIGRNNFHPISIS
jgi:hypothetical protein